MKIKYKTKDLPVTTIGVWVTTLPNQWHKETVTFRVDTVEKNWNTVEPFSEYGLVCRGKSTFGMYEQFLRLATPEEITKYKKDHHED